MVHLNGISQTSHEGTVRNYNVGDGFPVLLDSGCSLTYLPPAIVKAIAKDYPGSKFNRVSNVYNVPCNPPAGSIDFTFGDKKTIKVPYADLIWRYGTPNLCGLGLSVTTDNFFILGDSFLRASYAVFDLENRQVWLDQADDCGTNLVTIGKGGNAVPEIVGCRCSSISSVNISNMTTPLQECSATRATESGSASRTSSLRETPSPTVKSFQNSAKTIYVGWFVYAISLSVAFWTLNFLR